MYEHDVITHDPGVPMDYEIYPTYPDAPVKTQPVEETDSLDEKALERAIKLLLGNSHHSQLSTSTMVHVSMRVGTGTVTASGSTRLAALKGLLSEVVKLNTPLQRGTRHERGEP